MLLKNKLYKHHYISIIIMIILDLIYKIIAGESIIERHNDYFHFFAIILSVLFYSLHLVLYKYYMLKKYIQSYEILFF